VKRTNYRTSPARLAALAALLTPLTSARASAAPARPYNVVIVAVDGLRADHLGSYGYARDTTPNMDKLAAAGVQFRHAVAQASWTLPSFASLFTSEYPQTHGAFHPGRRLGGKEPFLAQIFKEHGYRTGGFVGGPFLEPNYGFARGFDVYRSGGSRSFKDTTPAALDFIRQHKNERFFVFLHGNDVHPPFDLPGDGEDVRLKYDQDYAGPVDGMQLDYYFVRIFNRIMLGAGEPQPDEAYLAKVDAIRGNPKDIRHIVAHYDNQVSVADRYVGEVRKVLEEQGLLKNTIVVVVADHGLELDEKTKLMTGYHLTQWETITHVPLILSSPDIAPRKVNEVVELVDLAPTLLEMTGIPAPAAFQGASLVPLLDGAPKKFARTLGFSVATKVEPADRIPMFSVRDARWKLIYDDTGGTSQLYDLEKDPEETKNLIDAEPQAALALTQKLLQHIRDTSLAAHAEAKEPPPDLLERLRKAGYR
jgi:arylsulfatase A-like enzyme